MEKQLTDGDWEIRSLIGLDKDKKSCFFTAAKESALEMHLYRLDLASGEIKRLTEQLDRIESASVLTNSFTLIPGVTF